MGITLPGSGVVQPEHAVALRETSKLSETNARQRVARKEQVRIAMPGLEHLDTFPISRFDLVDVDVIEVAASVSIRRQSGSAHRLPPPVVVARTTMASSASSGSHFVDICEGANPHSGNPLQGGAILGVSTRTALKPKCPRSSSERERAREGPMPPAHLREVNHRISTP